MSFAHRRLSTSNMKQHSLSATLVKPRRPRLDAVTRKRVGLPGKESLRTPSPADIVAIANRKTDLLLPLRAAAKPSDPRPRGSSSSTPVASSAGGALYSVLNGLGIRSESIAGPSLGDADAKACLTLLESNMSDYYVQSGWGWDRAAKRSGLLGANSRILLLRSMAPPQLPRYSATAQRQLDAALSQRHLETQKHGGQPTHGELLGFLHLEFCVENRRPVLYVLELQLAPQVRGMGLGKFAMALAERLASAHAMRRLMLTVFKANARAHDFYKRLGYTVDESSPSRCGQLDTTYEILSKDLRHRASSNAKSETSLLRIRIPIPAA